MSLIFLIDLDDTLLINSMDRFLPGYLKSLGAALAHHVDPNKMVSCLMMATDQMMRNNNPTKTLEKVFNEHFYRCSGIDQQAAEEDLIQFYRESFPKLRALTSPRPGAVELIREVVQRGYEVVIATNPLFPLTAIEQRLEWAGLPIGEIPYRLVPSIETAHYAKPNPAYFTELLSKIGWPDVPVVMVGDDLEMDILPCQDLGIPAYWVPVDLNNVPPGTAARATWMGPLEGVLSWIDQANPESLKPNLNHPAAIHHTLRSTPAALPTLLQSIPEDKWNTQANGNEWSLAQNLKHFRDVEIQVNLPRIQKILAEDNPFIVGLDTDKLNSGVDTTEETASEALLAFTAARLKTLNILESLAKTDWQKTARHSIFGPTTLQELVGFMAGHDRLHIQQIHTLIQQTQ